MKFSIDRVKRWEYSIKVKEEQIFSPIVLLPHDYKGE